jgi:hypothetical protein
MTLWMTLTAQQRATTRDRSLFSFRHNLGSRKARVYVPSVCSNELRAQVPLERSGKLRLGGMPKPKRALNAADGNASRTPAVRLF